MTFEHVAARRLAEMFRARRIIDDRKNLRGERLRIPGAC
jgi:hypothetical protein